MLRQAADLACRMSAAALASQAGAGALPGALSTALRALGASQLRGFTTDRPLGPRYQVRGDAAAAAAAASAACSRSGSMYSPVTLSSHGMLSARSPSLSAAGDDAQHAG